VGGGGRGGSGGRQGVGGLASDDAGTKVVSKAGVDARRQRVGVDKYMELAGGLLADGVARRMVKGEARSFDGRRGRGAAGRLARRMALSVRSLPGKMHDQGYCSANRQGWPRFGAKSQARSGRAQPEPGGGLSCGRAGC
jgi:hypothetical protein